MTNMLIVAAISHRYLAANATSAYEGESSSSNVVVALGVLLGLLVLFCICCTFICCYWMDNEEKKPYVVKEEDLEKGKEEAEKERKKKAPGTNSTVVVKEPTSPKKKKEGEVSDGERPYPLCKEKTFETKPSIKMYQGSQNFDNYITSIGSQSSDAFDSPRVPVSTEAEMVQFDYNDKDIEKYAERHLKPKLQHQQSYFSRYGFESMNYAETGTSFRMLGGSSWYDKTGNGGEGVSGKVRMTTGNYYLMKHNAGNSSNNSNNVSLQSSSTSSVSMGSSTNTMQ